MRYCFNVVEQAVMNPKSFGYRSVRVEIYDKESHSDFAVYEASVLLPAEFMDGFIELFDGKESDLLPSILWEKPEDPFFP